MTLVERLPAADPGPFAEPLPHVRDGYTIRSAPKRRVIAAMDRLLSLLPVRRRPAPTEPQRILLANWAHLGDVTTTLGAVRLLRERFPAARIDMLVSSGGRSAATMSGLIDHFHVVDHWRLSRAPGSSWEKWKRYAAQSRAVVRAIAAIRYDIAIDFYFYFPAAHPLFYRAGIPVRVGFASTGFGPLLTHPVAWHDQDRPIADHYAALLAAAWPDLPLPGGALRPRLPRSNVPALPEAVAASGRYLVVHTGAGAAFKDWGIDRWHALLATLRETPEFRDRAVVLTGAGAAETETAAKLHAAAPWTIDMAGRANWEAFVAIVAHADAVICPDTVTSHVAAELDKPVVSIFTGANNPHHWGPYADRARVLVQDVACAPCYRVGCAAMACIRGVSVESVVAALRAVLHPDRIATDQR